MTDLATLGLQIDSTQVPKAVGELDKLTAAGARAEGSVMAISRGTNTAGAAASQYAAEVEKLRSRIDPLYGSHVKLHGELGQVSKLMGAGAITAAEAGRATAFLSKEAELAGKAVHGVGFASSTATREILVMMREAGRGDFTRMAGSATILAQSLGLMSRAATVLLPLLGGLAATAVILGPAFLGVKQSTASDAALKKFAGTLGLTHSEMKRLKDETVSWGDVGKATFQVLAEKAGTSASAITGWFSGAFKKVGEFGKFSVQIIVGAFTGLWSFLKAMFTNLPALVGQAFDTLGNFAIAAVEKMVNFFIKAINKLGSGVNSLIDGTNGLLGTSVGHIGAIADVSLGRLENKFAGTAGKIGTAGAEGFFKGFRGAERFFDDVSQRASNIAGKRLKGQADEIIGDRPEAKAAREARAKAQRDVVSEYEKAIKASQDYIASLEGEISKIGKTTEQIKAMEVALAAANAPLDADREKILALGLAWEVATKMFEAGKASLADGMDLNLDNLFSTSVVDDFFARMQDGLNATADRAQVTGEALSNAFGNAGGVIGSLIANLADYKAKQAEVNALPDGSKDRIAGQKALATLNARNTAAAISGIKSIFKEHSAAFKIMSAIEKAYAAFQAAETIASIARDFLKTGTHLANSGVRTSANVTEGGSKIFADLGPWAFPVVAAMIAVMAALGFGGRGGGGASGPSIPTAQDNQDRQGTGSVLGDSKAKSESIAHSLEIVASNTNKDLEYSNGMLRALHSIDNSIAKMAGTVAQQIKVSGSLFDTTGRGLGTTGSGGFLGIGAKSMTRSLYDLGLNLNSASVGSIINGGVSGSTYQTVEQIKKKSGFLGIGGSTRTSYQTTNGTIDPAITGAIQDVVTSLRDGLVAGADVIGLTGAKAILDAFQVNIGKISFKDLTGAQIEDTLNAVFSKVGDEMAQALLPSLASMQKVGEGLFETFSRVAREYQVVDVVLQSIGKTFGMVGLASVAARDNLVQLAGGLDEFVSQTNFFRDNFLSAAEQISPTQKAVTEEMRRLGLAGVKTRDQFKNAVLGLNLTTEAGQAMYASLMAVAPAFDKVLNYFDAANKKAASALQSTADKFGGFADSLRKYRESLFGAGSATATYAQLRAKFSATAALAGAGNEAALGGLESSGKAFLDAARDNAATLVDYQRDVALVAQGVDKGIFAADAVADYAKLQLAALTNAVTILGQISVNTAPLAAPAGSRYQSLPSNETSVPVLEAQNATIINQNAAMLEYMRKQSTLWSRFDGDGMLIRTDSDTPIRTYV